jgi:protein-L-isoaspartate O-methyltransferase
MHNVDTLIETGTYLGDMTYAQRKLFKQIYTIELSETLYKKAVDRLKTLRYYSEIAVLS